MFPIKDDQPRYSTPFVNGFLIALNIFIFLLQWVELVQDPRLYEMTARQFGVVPAHLTAFLQSHSGYAAGQVMFPFITSMFLHGGWMHVLGNMWFLWIFGKGIEDLLGHARFLIFYLACGVAAGIIHTFTNYYSPVPTLGASGARVASAWRVSSTSSRSRGPAGRAARSGNRRHQERTIARSLG